MTIEDKLEEKALNQAVDSLLPDNHPEDTGDDDGDGREFKGAVIPWQRFRANGSLTVSQNHGGSVIKSWQEPVVSEEYRRGWRLGFYRNMADIYKKVFARWSMKHLGITAAVELLDDLVNAQSAGLNHELLNLQKDALTRSTMNIQTSNQQRGKNNQQPGANPMGKD